MSPHMFSQYCELRPTSGWDVSARLEHPSKFQRVSRLGSVTARHSSSGGVEYRAPPTFGRAAITWGIGQHSSSHSSVVCKPDQCWLHSKHPRSNVDGRSGRGAPDSDRTGFAHPPEDWSAADLPAVQRFAAAVTPRDAKSRGLVSLINTLPRAAPPCMLSGKLSLTYCKSSVALPYRITDIGRRRR